jgi:hypothetical protein
VSLSLLTVTLVGSPGVGSVAPPVSVVSESHAVRVPVPGPGGVAASTANVPWASRNWSGYAITGATYTSATGSWTVPVVNAPKHRKKNQFSSTWVGIDGFLPNDNHLIQAGTEQDWLNGSAFYQAWWEILPAFETPITSITVHPGDVMTVAITQGAPHWTIVVTDTSTGQSFTTKQTYGGALTSAEWIQEAPTVNGRIAPLAHDATFDFDLATVNGVAPGFVDADSGVMVKGRGGQTVISTPSSPNPAQDGFAVAYGSVAPPPPTG